MRILLAILLIAFGAAEIQAQTEAVDVVYLHDGSVVRGVITEMIPGQSVRIQTKDGSIFVFEMSRVQRITRESPTTAPQVAPNHAPQPQAAPPYASPQLAPAKDPTMGLLFSVVVPGGGHFYAGETGKGLFLAGGTLASWLLPGILAQKEVNDCFDDYYNCYDSVEDITTIAYVGYAAALGLWVYGIVDGQNAVKRYNQRVGGVQTRLSMRLMSGPGDATLRPGISARVSF